MTVEARFRNHFSLLEVLRYVDVDVDETEAVALEDVGEGSLRLARDFTTQFLQRCIPIDPTRPAACGRIGLIRGAEITREEFQPVAARSRKFHKSGLS